MNFTSEQISLLAEAERNMDEGKTPFVILTGQRVSVNQDVMTELGLAQGQTITDQIFLAVLRTNIAFIEAQIAIRKACAQPST